MDKESLIIKIKGNPPSLKGGDVTVGLYSYLEALLVMD